MSKVYVLNEIEYEYNDEYSYSNDNAGKPVRAFSSLEKAQEEKMRKTVELFIPKMSSYPISLSEYIGYNSAKEVFDYEKFRYICEKNNMIFSEEIEEELSKFEGEDYYYECNCKEIMKLIESINDAEIKRQLFDCLQINFYEIIEVELEENN